MGDWGPVVLQGAIGAIAMAAVMGWITKSRDRVRPASEKHRLVHVGLPGFRRGRKPASVWS